MKFLALAIAAAEGSQQPDKDAVLGIRKMATLLPKLLKIFAISIITLDFLHLFAEVDAENRQVGRRKDKALLNGIHLKVSLYEQKPLLTYVDLPLRNSTIVVEGAYAELMENMAKFFNLTFSYVLIHRLRWVTEDPFVLVMNQLLHNETDLGLIPFSRTLEYSTKMDLSVSLHIMPYIFLQPFPLPESRLRAPIRPFSGEVWICFLFSIPAIITAMALVTFYNKRQGSTNEPKLLNKIFYESFAYVITILLTQGNLTPSSARVSLRVMVGLWLLMVVVLINAYTGTLTSYLSAPKLEPLIETFEQLVARNKKVTTERGSPLHKMSMSATSGLFKSIGDDLRANPSQIISRYEKGFENMVKHGNVYCGPELVAQIMQMNIVALNAGDKCLVTLAKKRLPLSVDGAIGMKKGMPYNDVIDKRYLMYMWESGLLNVWIRRYRATYVADLKCNANQRGNTDPFKLMDFSSIFFLFIVGLVISFLIFLLEFLIGAFLIKKKQNAEIIDAFHNRLQTVFISIAAFVVNPERTSQNYTLTI